MKLRVSDLTPRSLTMFGWSISSRNLASFLISLTAVALPSFLTTCEIMELTLTARSRPVRLSVAHSTTPKPPLPKHFVKSYMRVSYLSWRIPGSSLPCLKTFHQLPPIFILLTSMSFSYDTSISSTPSLSPMPSSELALSIFDVVSPSKPNIGETIEWVGRDDGVKNSSG